VSSAPAGALDPADLLVRFAAARLAALQETLGFARPTTDERSALDSVPPEQRDALARRVYWNAWRLGRSAARAHGEVNEPERLCALLGASGLDCARGTWRADGTRRRLEREGCPTGEALGIAACDFFREALDGLVSGLSGRLRFARLASRGHGAQSCADVVYSERDPTARSGPVPAEVSRQFAQPIARLRVLGVSVELLGLAENRLHVEVAGLHAARCGPTGLYFDLLADHLVRHFPDLVLVDASPRAVMT
jgi:hypothetical protein